MGRNLVGMVNVCIRGSLELVEGNQEDAPRFGFGAEFLLKIARAQVCPEDRESDDSMKARKQNLTPNFNASRNQDTVEYTRAR